jgi:hypothetical protein
MSDEKSIEQLREEAIAANAAQAEAPTKAEAKPEGEEQVVYVREIDLQDGSGVQRFEADTLEGLVDKLASAQENATRKIREQAAELKKAAPAAAVAPAPMTETERFLLSQELMSDPEAAFKKIYERSIGPTREKEMVELREAARFVREAKASNEFVEKHPEFHPSPANGDRMTKYLRAYNLEGTLENLETAFRDLSESGLLEAKTDSTADTTNEETEPTRIARPAETVRVVRKVASGLSARRSAPAPAPKEPTEADYQKMSLDELRDKALAAVAQGL